MKCSRCSGEARTGLKLCEQCAVKAAAENLRWRAENREHVANYAKRYSEANAELMRARCRDWYGRNRESVLPRSRKSARERYEADPERAKADARNWQLANPEKRKKISATWKRKNLDKGRMYANKRRTRLAGCLTHITQEEWHSVLVQHDNRCAYCLERGDRLTMDHVVAVARGGEDTAENIVPACLSCNAGKGDRSLLEWLLIRRRKSPAGTIMPKAAA